jgi:hypothetical protein
MEKMLDILKEISKYIINIEMQYDENYDRCEYLIDGFYKSGTVRLYKHENTILVESRYQQIDEIEDIEDLVRLNYRWWINSRDRYDGWKNPDSRWIPLLEKYNLIQREVNMVVTYK